MDSTSSVHDPASLSLVRRATLSGSPSLMIRASSVAHREPSGSSRRVTCDLAAEDDDAVGVGVRTLERDHVLGDPELAGDLAVLFLGGDVQRLAREPGVPDELDVFALREGRRAVVADRRAA